jgi:putative SOS response-associated peptidase YedK
MCNTYNLRHRNEAILDIARALQLPLTPDLPEFPPRHRIGIRRQGLILRPDKDGALIWSWARWSLIPPLSREVPPYPLNNARSDKLAGWPWKAVKHQRCLVPASGFWEPEKPARAKGTAPWSYYSLQDGRPFFMVGLWSDAPDPGTGEVADSYTVIITDANAVIRVHDRMPAILPAAAARQWFEPGPLRPVHLLVARDQGQGPHDLHRMRAALGPARHLAQLLNYLRARARPSARSLPQSVGDRCGKAGHLHTRPAVTGTSGSLTGVSGGRPLTRRTLPGRVCLSPMRALLRCRGSVGGSRASPGDYRHTAAPSKSVSASNDLISAVTRFPSSEIRW